MAMISKYGAHASGPLLPVIPPDLPLFLLEFDMIGNEILLNDLQNVEALLMCPKDKSRIVSNIWKGVMRLERRSDGICPRLFLYCQPGHERLGCCL
jgi:hypothetical protein